ncbi:hypothetical protein [Thermincola potens]|uniref:Uncharacterized protein n=1 Tax=Thermincola potens (strain JR) TaxID=635013 RepID=D5XAZ7_THEPJ|nr:hypothetical protein [Thermincola potens]ADG81317.1 hypothetical protein TherJR_0434 [Thermincola potens JR]
MSQYRVEVYLVVEAEDFDSALEKALASISPEVEVEQLVKVFDEDGHCEAYD